MCRKTRMQTLVTADVILEHLSSVLPVFLSRAGDSAPFLARTHTSHSSNHTGNLKLSK